MKAHLQIKNKIASKFHAVLMVLVLSMAFVFGYGVVYATAPSTGIGFQGQLTNSGTPVNGSVSASFAFYNALSGGAQQGTTINKTVSVSNGYFAVDFDESDISGIDFNQSLWLQVTIQGNTLTPRSRINSVPFANKSFGTFSYNSAPTVGATGSLYYNSATQQLMVSNGSSWIQVASSTGTVNSGATGQIAFYGANGSTISGTSTLFISGNKIGIGTTTPNGLLSVNKIATTTDSASELIGISSVVSGDTNIDNTYGIKAVARSETTSRNEFGGYFLAESFGANESYGVYAKSATNNYDYMSTGVYGEGATYGLYGIGNGSFSRGIYASGQYIGADIVSGAGAPYGVSINQSNTSGYSLYAAGGGKNYFESSVGIGTTTPAAKLDVWGNLRVATSSVPVLFANTATGNVGIGTTSSNTNKLTVAGAIVGGTTGVSGLTANSIVLDYCSGCGNTNRLLAIGSSTVSEAVFQIATANSNASIYNALTFTGGKLGLGSSTPSAVLSVVDGSDWMTMSGTGFGTKFVSSGDTLFRSGGIAGTGANKALYFDADTIAFRSAPGTQDYARITSSGNFGIGTTSPTSVLSISRATAPEISIYNSSSLKNWRVGSGVGSGSANTTFGIADGTTSRFLIDGSGNIGIGTTSPGTKLDVWGNLQVGTSSTPVLYVNSGTGYLGISSSTPNALLAISGTLSSSGNAPTALAVYGGTGGSAGTGGAIILSTGAGGSGASGGALTLQTGAGGSGASGGTINILAGNSVSSGIGGAINITAGGGSGSSAGGVLTLTSGSGGASGGTGGVTNVTGGTGGSSARGGNVYIYGGTGGSGSTPGDIILGLTSSGLIQGKVGIGTSSPFAQITASSSSTVVTAAFDQRGTGDILQLLDAGSTVFTVKDGGNVGIGTTTPNNKLVVVGNAQFTAVTSGTYASDLNITADGTLTTSASDIRLKENILEISSSTLPGLLALKTYNFTWKNDLSHRKDFGLIAQDVEQVFPELVFTNSVDGYKGINYSRLSVLLLKGMQEQQVQLDELKKYATFIRTKELHTEKLCVGSETSEICLTKSDLEQLLLNSKMTIVPQSAPITPVAPATTLETTTTQETPTTNDPGTSTTDENVQNNSGTVPGSTADTTSGIDNVTSTNVVPTAEPSAPASETSQINE